jgi:acetyltransferase
MTDMETIAKEIVKISKLDSKPVYTSFMGETDVAEGIDILLKNEIPHYMLPESMSHAYSKSYSFREFLLKAEAEDKIGDKITDTNNRLKIKEVDIEKARELLERAKASGRKVLSEYESSQILKCFSMPVLASGLACSESEAVDIAQKVGFPVVMKIASEDIIHKYDVNGVILNINTRSEVREAYSRILNNVRHFKPEARLDGITVEKMITGGEEIILGIKNDPIFGSLIMFGLGGIFVEIFKDVTFRVAPVSRSSINKA